MIELGSAVRIDEGPDSDFTGLTGMVIEQANDQHRVIYDKPSASHGYRFGWYPTSALRLEES